MTTVFILLLAIFCLTLSLVLSNKRTCYIPPPIHELARPKALFYEPVCSNRLETDYRPKFEELIKTKFDREISTLILSSLFLQIPYKQLLEDSPSKSDLIFHCVNVKISEKPIEFWQDLCLYYSTGKGNLSQIKLKYLCS